MGSRAKAGSVAGHSDRSRGYVDIRIDAKKYKAHRLAWLYVHGRWPEKLIDHINGVKTDNRLINLREASAAENAMNNPSLGVYWCKRRRAWRAFISVGGFQSEQEALDARRRMAEFVYGPFARRKEALIPPTP